jgi:hypothetical protein
LDKDADQQPQQIYPHQYPPYAYPPPYDQLHPPPKKDDSKSLIIIVVIIVVVFVLPMVMAAVLYSIVIRPAPPMQRIPTGVWGVKTIISPTAVDVDFGIVYPEPAPMDLSIILIRNGTDQGHYVFDDNWDGTLSIIGGVPVGTLTYRDVADNQRVDVGDSILLTNLLPNSDYSLKMIWAPTGDQITTTYFSTPP